MYEGTGRDHVRSIDAELLRQELESHWRVTVLDVRPKAEFRDPRGHIARAISIPMSDLLGRWRELESHQSDLVVVVSGHGHTSHIAALELEFAGFTEVQTLEGGMAHWWDLGYPVERCPQHV
jgi:rhodanese-related sulfurtransferase